MSWKFANKRLTLGWVLSGSSCCTCVRCICVHVMTTIMTCIMFNVKKISYTMFVAFVHVPTVDCVCRLFCSHSPPAHNHFALSLSISPISKRNGCSINVCCRETNVAWKKQILINQFVNKSKNLSTYLFCFVPAAHIFLYLHLRFGNFFSLHCLSFSLSLFIAVFLSPCVFLLVGLYLRRDDWWRCASFRFALLSFSLILTHSHSFSLTLFLSFSFLFFSQAPQYVTRWFRWHTFAYTHRLAVALIC